MKHLIVSAANEKKGSDYYEIHARTAGNPGVIDLLPKVGKTTTDYSLISYRLNYRVGYILTQIDAVLSDPVQPGV